MLPVNITKKDLFEVKLILIIFFSNSGLVRCETAEHLEGLVQNYEIYALGTMDMINYHLYPRNFIVLAQ